MAITDAKVEAIRAHIRGSGLPEEAAAELEARVLAVLQPDIDHYRRCKEKRNAQLREAYRENPEPRRTANRERRRTRLSTAGTGSNRTSLQSD